MRILWFTLTSSNYTPIGGGGYNGGGWISSLENELCKIDNIELGVAFHMNGQPSKIINDNVTYYPMPRIKNTWIAKMGLRMGWGEKYLMKNVMWPIYEKSYLRIIEDFKPDIIEVFGSESAFGLVANQTNIPIVLHIQGIKIPYLNAFLPPFVSWNSYIWESFNPIKIYNKILTRRFWRQSCYQEKEIISRVKYFIGRTDWDERITKVINPNAQYLYGSEILRPSFYTLSTRTLPDKFTIISTISNPLYKGFDLILKTAKWLKQELNMDFCWHVYGNINPKITEHKLCINHVDVNIELKGVATSEILQKAILNASAYVHPSYIDNSPNSLCEAQILGCPVIATYVGGIPSLVEEGKTGFLVPANDPYQLAFVLYTLEQNSVLNRHMGENGRKAALMRHNPELIITKLLNDFRNIIADSTH